MRKIFFILLFPALLLAQNTYTYSPYQVGGDWQIRHNEMRENLVAYLSQECSTIEKDGIWWLDSYSYNISDSSFALADMSEENFVFFVALC